jgi:hypothetical protein
MLSLSTSAVEQQTFAIIMTLAFNENMRIHIEQAYEDDNVVLERIK